MALTRSSLNLSQFIRSGVSATPPSNSETNSSTIAPPSFYFDAFRSTRRVIKSPPKKQQESLKRELFASPRSGPGRETPPKPKRTLVIDENEDINVNGEMEMQTDFKLEDHVEEGESYIEVLRRMKDKHEQNLQLIEQIYYADTEGSRPQTDHDHLLSLYDGSGGAFSTRFSCAAPKKAWTGESTKPAPFSFLKKNDGERKNQMGIARRRCLEYLSEVKEREEAELKKTFKANPIPRSTTEPRFQQMKDHWERRRDETKQLQAWMTPDDDETFTFVKRDEERVKRKEWEREPEPIENEQHFHAKPIPWSVKVALYDRLQHDNEERRKKRIAERAAMMLKKSSLPQRMAIYERTKGQKKRLLRQAAQKQSESNQSKLRKSHDVPDFEKLQAQFQQNLDKARQSKSPTKPVGFSFSARPMKLRNRHEEASTPKRTPRYKRDPNPPQTTKKFLDAVAHLNAKIEERKRQEDDAAEAAAKLRMDPDKRKILAERIRVHMLDNSAELERRHEESLRIARERDRQLAKETAERLREMQDRMDQRPLLLESNGSNSFAKRLARQKALLSVKESLINAGISDYKNFFSEEELKDLEITDL